METHWVSFPAYHDGKDLKFPVKRRDIMIRVVPEHNEPKLKKDTDHEMNGMRNPALRFLVRL